MIEIKILEEVDSTNRYADSIASSGKPVLVAAKRQTAGRGQRGNSWESEPGKNLTVSLLWFPRDFKATLQFSLSEAVALATVDLLRAQGIEAKVKWPNDIYVYDKKICGILIEHSVLGMNISHTVAGVGINVNQKRFVSDAPNPVSMVQLLGKEFDLDILLDAYCAILGKRLIQAESEEGRDTLHKEYISGMWRNDGGFYFFRNPLTGEKFKGSINNVKRSGILEVKEEKTSSVSEYAFKQIEFLLD